MRWLALMLVVLAAGCAGGEDEVVPPPSSSIAIYHLERDLRGPSAIGEILCLPAAGACPNARPLEEAQYLVLSGSRLGDDDVDRERTRADYDPSGQAVVLLALTDDGAEKLHALSRAIARAGRAAGTPHHFAVVVNGELVGWPALDYRAFPNGFVDRSSIQIAFADGAAAKRLVERVRS